MSATLLPKTIDSSTGGRCVLHGVGWDFYESLLTEMERHGVRAWLNYDEGTLEIMAPSYRHESCGRTLGRLLLIVCEVFRIRTKGTGSTTLRHPDVEKGLEADESFYIAHVDEILGKDEIDLTEDPPPDLAIEVDIHSSSVSRMDLYAGLRVAEVWRCDGQRIRVFCLNEHGQYEERDRSPTFPFLPLDRLMEFVLRAGQVDDITLYDEFRDWLRTDILPHVHPDA